MCNQACQGQFESQRVDPIIRRDSSLPHVNQRLKVMFPQPSKDALFSQWHTGWGDAPKGKEFNAGKSFAGVKDLFGLAKNNDGHGLDHSPWVQSFRAGPKDVEEV